MTSWNYEMTPEAYDNSSLRILLRICHRSTLATPPRHLGRHSDSTLPAISISRRKRLLPPRPDSRSMV
jgi:hypothetical protein